MEEVRQAIQLPEAMQEFPRIMVFEFSNDSTDESRPVATLHLHDAWPNAFPHGPIMLESGVIQGYKLQSELGDRLTDQSATNDGFRFHDAFHIGIVTNLGWSPIMRSLLHIRRRGDPQVDEIEDGARARIFEESLFDFLGTADIKDGSSVEDDINLLLASLLVQRFFRTRSLGAKAPKHEIIEDALLEGARLFHDVRLNLGGFVIANLDDKSAIYQPK